MTGNGQGVYIHFPWCVRKCPYCDFNSHPLKGELMEEAYLKALLADIDHSRSDLEARPLTSLFMGGGTPSLFSPQVFEQLLHALPEVPPEVTLEANPGTTERHDFSGYRHAGITRLSLGAQSFSDSALEQLGRIHHAAETLDAFERARRSGFDNINLDLMYGLPGQNVADACADLEVAIRLGPEHISWYELTLEPRTEFHRRPPVLPEEDTLHDIETAGHAALMAAGYRRYEVSAWAKPGRTCAHNLNYWRFGDYVGIGAGAHGKITRGRHRLRTLKPSQPRLYMTDPCAVTETVIEPLRLRFEFLLNALRLVDGVEFADFTRATGLGHDALDPEWRAGVDAGLLRTDRVAATPLGYRFLDGVLQTFL